MKKSISLDEQETILNIVPAQISGRVSVYTCIPADVKYFRKLVSENPDEAVIIKADSYGLEVEIPVSWYRRPKPHHKRQMTEEQRAATATRLSAARQKRREV